VRRTASLATALILSLAVVMAMPGAAQAHPGVPLGGPTVPTDLTFAATDNINYLGRFPEHAGTAGGRLSADGKTFYLTDPRGVYVYDTTDPESPELLGSVPLFQSTTGAALAQEDPDTNEEILLVDGSPSAFGTARLQVVDVSDPEAGVSIIGSVAVTDHTWTCVSGPPNAAGDINTCQYAYGRTGHIIDLTDPTAPVNLSTTWRQAIEGMGNRSNSPYTHDLTEIRPGLVMTAGRDAILMDTTDPTSPVELTRVVGTGRFNTFGYHSAEWADGGLAPHLVLGTEIAPPPVAGLPSATENLAASDCQGDESVIETWDARDAAAAIAAFDAAAAADEPITYLEAFDGVQFTPIDTFDAAGRGIYLQGQAPGHVLYCAHWMDLHPSYGEDGGLMAVSYYDRGTRFVKADAEGEMEEIGWITALESYSGSARWISEDVVYIMDYRRGMEVVKIEGEASGTFESAGTMVALTSSFTPPPSVHMESMAMPALLLLIAGAWLAERRRQAALLA
jgi:hypothetical protein